MSFIIFIVPILLSVGSWFGFKYITRNVGFLNGFRNSILASVLWMFASIQLWNFVLNKFLHQ